MPVKAIVFDFNGIFSEPIEFQILKSVCAKLGFGKVIAVSNYVLNIFRFEKGQLKPFEFWQRVFPCIEESQYSEWIEKGYENPLARNEEAYALADKLPKKYALYCLSNSNPLQANALKKQGLYSPFQRVFLSHEIHAAKPFPRAYLKLLEKTGLKPREIVFIDDSRRNVATAKLLGFRAMRYRNAGHLEDQLRKSRIL